MSFSYLSSHYGFALEFFRTRCVWQFVERYGRKWLKAAHQTWAIKVKGVKVDRKSRESLSPVFRPKTCLIISIFFVETSLEKLYPERAAKPRSKNRFWQSNLNSELLERSACSATASSNRSAKFSFWGHFRARTQKLVSDDNSVQILKCDFCLLKDFANGHSDAVNGTDSQ